MLQNLYGTVTPQIEWLWCCKLHGFGTPQLKERTVMMLQKLHGIKYSTAKISCDVAKLREI